MDAGDAAVPVAPSLVLPRSRRSLLALPPLARILVAAQLLLLLVTVPLYRALGLEIDWPSCAPVIAAHAALVGLWLYFRRYADHPKKAIVVDVLIGAGLIAMLTDIVAPAQYVAVALKRPLIDPWLARADHMMGINVQGLAAWTALHPVVSAMLTLCYVSLLPQFFLPLLVLGLVFRNREHLWEYVFHFHLCLIVTLAALAFFPAACAFQHYGFQSTLDQTRFIAHFSALRDGTFKTIVFHDMEGLISMPSFHAAGGLMVTWAFRRYPIACALLALLNVGMLTATFMSGAHYFVDVLASAMLFGVSVMAYRTIPPLRRL